MNLPLFTTPKGATFNPAFDAERLGAQARRVFNLMNDGKVRTLREIAAATGDGEASVSARLRDARGWDGWTMLSRRRKGQEHRGVWEYQLVRVHA